METNWLPLEQEKLVSISKKTIDGVTVDSMIDPADLPIAIKASFDKDRKILKVLFKYRDEISSKKMEFATTNKSMRMIYSAHSLKIDMVEFNVDLLKAAQKNGDVFSYEINKIRGSQPRSFNEYVNDILEIIRKVCQQKADTMKSLVTNLTPRMA